MPRLRPRPKTGTAFRHESPEDKLIREHNLFNPQEQDTQNGIWKNWPGYANEDRATFPISLTSSADLERELLFLATNRPPSTRTLNILHDLLHDRSERLNARHYEALILANSSEDYGSAENVAKILEEMEQAKIPFDVNVYTAILRTLVVHPDVDILAFVIESCESMWIDLDAEMLHFITAVYLRAHMLELAQDYLDRIEGSPAQRQSQGKAELWLYVLFIRALALQGDWDGALRVCYRLNDDTSLGIPFAMRQIDIPHDFWHWLLDKVAFAEEVWVSEWIWRLWVLRAWVEPNEKLCTQVLKIFAEHGLVKQAYSASAVYEEVKARRAVKRWNEGSSKTSDSTVQRHFNPYNEDTTNDYAESAERERLLRLATKNRDKDAASISNFERRIPAPFWQLFKDSPEEFGPSPRMDSWAMLTEDNDVGRAWPRVLREREDYVRRSQYSLGRRKFATAERSQEECLQTSLTVLPAELLQDIEHVANVVPEHEWEAPPPDVNESATINENGALFHSSFSTEQETESNEASSPNTGLRQSATVINEPFPWLEKTDPNDGLPPTETHQKDRRTFRAPRRVTLSRKKRSDQSRA